MSILSLIEADKNYSITINIIIFIHLKHLMTFKLKKTLALDLR